jgi:hypothetical protein
MTVTNTAERARRVSDLWNRRPNMTEGEVIAQVDAQLAREAAEQAEQTARADALTASATALMFACAACGGSRMPSAPDGLCGPCRSVNVLLAGEDAAAEQIGGRSRRELVATHRARRAAAS